MGLITLDSVGSVVTHVSRMGRQPLPRMDLLLPLAVLAVAVPWSRRRPAASVVLVNGLCVVGLADTATPGNAHVLSLAALSCLFGARVAAARRPLLVLAGCAAVDLATCAVVRAQPVWWFYALTVLPAALLLPWLGGRHWRGRRQIVREGRRLARGLEERQHLVAERARLTERAGIAADMHDSLGHVLSLVALRAGALELSPDLTDRDRADLADLRGTVADAVEQLRETVAILQDPPGRDAGEGLPVKDTVEDLLSRAAASGVPVRRSGPDGPRCRQRPLLSRARTPPPRTRSYRSPPTGSPPYGATPVAAPPSPSWHLPSQPSSACRPPRTWPGN